jgi:hypothetical protein
MQRAVGTAVSISRGGGHSELGTPPKHFQLLRKSIGCIALAWRRRFPSFFYVIHTYFQTIYSEKEAKPLDSQVADSAPLRRKVILRCLRRNREVIS